MQPILVFALLILLQPVFGQQVYDSKYKSIVLGDSLKNKSKRYESLSLMAGPDYRRSPFITMNTKEVAKLAGTAGAFKTHMAITSSSTEELGKKFTKYSLNSISEAKGIKYAQKAKKIASTPAARVFTFGLTTLEIFNLVTDLNWRDDVSRETASQSKFDHFTPSVNNHQVSTSKEVNKNSP